MNSRAAARRTAVVGDGPAGAALAAACVRRGVDVVLHGTGEPWRPTYASWRDDVADLPDSVFSSVTDRVVVVGERRHEIGRSYGVFDNDALRGYLLTGVTERHGAVEPAALDADVVIDARGVGGEASPPRAWQTAFGVVLPVVPPGVGERDTVTLMDWRAPAGPVGQAGPPSFCYVVPVHDGWLIEETVLAAAPAAAPAVLRDRLVERLDTAGHDGAAIVASAVRTEEVRIPMGGPIRRGADPVVPFGAAAGYVHPATGYSVAAALRAAPRVARAIETGGDVADAVWPRAHRRARVLHEYGLDALVRLDRRGIAAFFDAFFTLPVESWADYLRVDTTPGAVAGVMRRVFRSAPWHVRRRLMTGSPLPLLRLLGAS